MGHDVTHQIVDFGRAQAVFARRLHFQNRLDDFVDPLPRLSRDEQQRRVAQKGQLGAHLFFVFGHSVGVFFHDVPLVHQHDDADVFLGQHAADVGVLRGDALLAVDQQQGHVGAAQRFDGPQYAVLLDAGVDLAPATDAGRVDNGEILAVPAQLLINGVARRAGDRADDDPLLADHAVEQRRFAYVGPAQNSDLDRLVGLVGFGIIRRNSLHNRVEQIARARPVQGRHGEHFAQPQLVEFVGCIPQLGRFQLVGGHDDRLLRLAQDAGYLAVGGGDARLAVHDEYDHVGGFHRHSRLLADEGHELLRIF